MIVVKLIDRISQKWGVCYPHSKLGIDNRPAKYWLTFEQDDLILFSFFVCEECKKQLHEGRSDRAKPN